MSKFIKSVYLLSLLLITSCSDDDGPTDQLEATGVLGAWEQTDLTVNGITSLTPNSGVELELFTDDDPDDLSGIYQYVENERFFSGYYSLDLDGGRIMFTGDNELERGFSIGSSKKTLMLSYIDGGDFIQTGFTRIE